MTIPYFLHPDDYFIFSTILFTRSQTQYNTTGIQVHCVFLPLFWCLCVTINVVRVQYTGGFLPVMLVRTTTRSFCKVLDRCTIMDIVRIVITEDVEA